MPTYRVANNTFAVQQGEYGSGPALNSAGFVGGVDLLFIGGPNLTAIIDDARTIFPSPDRPVAAASVAESVSVIASAEVAASYAYFVPPYDPEKFGFSWGGGVEEQYMVALDDATGFCCAAYNPSLNELCCVMILPRTLTLAQAEGLMRGALAEGFRRWPQLRDGTVVGQADPRDTFGVAALDFYIARYPAMSRSIDSGMVTNRWTARACAEAFVVAVP